MDSQISNIAPLETLRLSKLLQDDPEEISHMLRVCESAGFFYLNLDDGCGDIIQDWDDILYFSKDYFSQPTEVKLKDERQSDIIGYKPLGAYAGVKRNSKDHYENLKTSRDEMRSRAASMSPAIQSRIGLFDRFINTCNSITLTILNNLSSALHMTGEAHLATSHREDEKSRCSLILLHYPKQDGFENASGHNKHTDLGTLTLLFTRQWGLQVLHLEKKEWQYVAPKPGHAIVNVGDSLRFLSGNKLKSAVHRVFPINGRQTEERYSVGYFLRPANYAVFRDSQGRTITAQDWSDEKIKTFKASHAEQERAPILTGGMEKIVC